MLIHHIGTQSFIMAVIATSGYQPEQDQKKKLKYFMTNYMQCLKKPVQKNNVVKYWELK